MGRFPSGQRGQTVNLLAQPSKVQILLSPIFLDVINQPAAAGNSSKMCYINKGMASTEVLNEQKFYKNGLHFTCRRCSDCCRLSPGYVFLSEEDLTCLCRAAGIGRRKFIQRYCRKVDINGFKRISLREKRNFDCILWDESGCLFYKNRPLQCRSYPFWSFNLYSKETWENLKKSCPGIGRGKLHSCEEIDLWLSRRLSEPLISK